jgi:nucleoside-diphosphate-sugar epimerase
LPYKKSFSDPNIYKNQIKRVCDSLKFSSIKHVVFTSSSSVYPKDAKLYLPTDKFIPPNIRAEILLDCEAVLNQLKNISVITIRLGGIYGVGRKINKSKKNRRLIKQNDAISLIKESIRRVGEHDCINGFTIMAV